MGRVIGMICAIALSGCISSGTEVKKTQLAEFRAGVTTERDVTGALGPPQGVSTTANGNRIIVYSGSHGSPTAASFIPIVGLFVGGANAHGTSAIFTFGPDGKMTRMSQGESDVELRHSSTTVNFSPTTVSPQKAAPAQSVSSAPPRATASCPSLGVEMRDLSGAMPGLDGVQGALVTRVLPNGPAASAGVRQGDVLIRVGDVPINDPDDVYGAVCRVRAGAAIAVKISRGATPLLVSVQF